MYHRAIPMVVLAQVPVLAASVTAEPIAVEISSFTGDGDVVFGLDVTFNPRAVRVADRRKMDYVVAERVSIFLSPAGFEIEGRQHNRRQRLNSITIGKQTSAYTVIAEADFETELAIAERENLAAMLGRRGS